MRQRIAAWLRALADRLDPPIAAEPAVSIPVKDISALLTGSRVGRPACVAELNGEEHPFRGLADLKEFLRQHPDAVRKR